MSNVLRFPGEETESPPVGHDDAVPPPFSTRSDGRARGTPRRPPDATSDDAWAVAFMMNVAITVVSAVYYHHGTALTTLENTLGWKRSDLSGNGVGWGDTLLMLMLGVPLVYKIFSRVLGMMTTCSGLFLQLAGVAFLLGCATAVHAVAKFGSMLAAAALAVVCTGIAVALFLRPGRYSFAATNLKVAALAVESTPGIIMFTVCAMVVQGGWLALVGMASTGSVDAFQTVLGPDGATYRAFDCKDVATWSMGPSCECNGNIISLYGCDVSSPNVFLVCFWAVNAAWGADVIAKVVAATVADSVAVWWSSPGDVESVRVSFRRVMHSSLGSVCKVAGIAGGVRSLPFGSAMFLPSSFLTSLRAFGTALSRVHGAQVSNINRLRITVSYLLRITVGHLLRSTVSHLLGIGVKYLLCMAVIYLLRSAVIYLLHSTVYFISMYRLGSSEAARRAWALFRKHGWTLFVNEVNVVAGLLAVCLLALPVVVAGIVVAVVLGSLPYFFLDSSPSPLGFMVGGIIVSSAIMILATFQAVGYASKAVSICFIQDPEAFSASHDRWLYERMYKAGRALRLSHPTMTEEQRDALA